MILKKYKNRLYKILKEKDINISNLETESKVLYGQEVFTIKYKEHSFYFKLRNSEDSFHKFGYMFMEFNIGFKIYGWEPENGYSDFNLIIDGFRYWIDLHLSEFIEEHEKENLWETINIQNAPLRIEGIDFEDESVFSNSEKEQIKFGLRKTQKLLSENFNLNEEQIKLVGSRLKYLEESIERTNKTDWQNLGISTIIGLILNLGVDTNTGKAIWDLFHEALEVLPLLPMPI